MSFEGIWLAGQEGHWNIRWVSTVISDVVIGHVQDRQAYDLVDKKIPIIAQNVLATI